MEKIFFVKDDDLKEVNESLAKGGKVKMISTIAEGNGYKTTYAYIVVDMPED